jgi:hypothetical protein
MHHSWRAARRNSKGKLLQLTTSIIALALMIGFATPAVAAVLDQELVSISTAGVRTNNTSNNPAVSRDGRYAAFVSYATNLVANDTNGTEDVFVRDRLTGVTTRASVASDGTQGNGPSDWVSISGDGRYVAFESYASNLTGGDTNDSADIFVLDRSTGIVKRVSTAWNGSEGDDDSLRCSISEDGRYVAFSSAATNLIPGDDNAEEDVYVRDLATDTTRIASVATGGLLGGDGQSSAPSISSNGRYVTFASYATNLVTGDTNGARDIFIHDFALGTTTRASVSSAGAQGDLGSSSYPQLTPDGRYVAFGSSSTNLVSGDTNGIQDDFVHDNITGATRRISVSSAGAQGDNVSYPMLAISPNGRYVAFTSAATNLVSGDTNGMWDAFLHDNVTGATQRISVTTTGTQGDGGCFNPVAVSNDAHYVTYISGATNLVTGDTNGYADIFVAQVTPAATSITRTPSSASKTYRRKRGKVKFDLSAIAKSDFGRPVAGARIYLQLSPNGKTKWKSAYTLTTNANGQAIGHFTAKKKSTTYCRWYLPAASKTAAYTTSKQKIIVK